MKIYTKMGDGGRTRLAGGTEVSKDDPRVEAYGTVDELIAFVGAARVEVLKSQVESSVRQLMLNILDQVQEALMRLCSQVASLDRLSQTTITESDVKALEAFIDRVDAMLLPMKNFVIPGVAGAEVSLHIARTVCRRAERRVVALGEERLGVCVKFLNRLSDLLFVLARLALKGEGSDERVWSRGCS